MKSSQAKIWAKQRLKRSLSEKTKNDYRCHFERCMINKIVPGSEENPRSRIKSRAAARFAIAERIVSTEEDSKIVSFIRMLGRIDKLAEENEKLYKDGHNFKKVKRASKKIEIRKLKAGWQLELLTAMKKSKSFTAAAVMATCGCRPEEVAKGVRVRNDGQRVHFEIEGAKIEKNKGQVMREMSFPIDHPIASMIEDGLYQAGARQVSEAITRAANKCGFEGVSGYSFRHQFSADLKASGYSKRSIAGLMGHQSERSQESYGSRGSGRKIEVKFVQSTNEIRPKKTKRLRLNRNLKVKVNGSKLTNNTAKKNSKQPKPFK